VLLQFGSLANQRVISRAQGPIGSRVIDKVAEQVGDSFGHFLENFNTVAPEGQSNYYTYVEQLKTMIENDSSSLYVDFQHVASYDQSLSLLIEEEYYRFLIFLIL